MWCMVPETWSVADRIFCHFGLLFAHLPPNNPENQNFEKMKSPGNIIILHRFTIKWQLYDVWFLRYWARQTAFFVILDHFLRFYLLNNPKNQNFEKMKKAPGDTIILHMCTINDNHMMYGSWDMERDGQIFFQFWTVFCPFTPLTTRKIKILKNWKTSLEILSVYTWVPWMRIIWCMIPEILSMRDSNFGLFFALLPT